MWAVGGAIQKGTTVLEWFLNQGYASNKRLRIAELNHQ